MKVKKSTRIIILVTILLAIIVSGISIYKKEVSTHKVYSTPEKGLMDIKNTTPEKILKVEDNNKLSIVLFLNDTGWYETYYFFHSTSGWENVPKGKVVIQKSASNDKLKVLSVALVSEIKNNYIVAVSHMSNQLPYPMVHDSLNTEFKVIKDGINNDLGKNTYCYSSFAILNMLPDDYELYVNGETIKVN